MRKIRRITIAIVLSIVAGCGGGGGESDSSAASCNAFKVFNGEECISDSIPVVRLNVNDAGSCTGTIVSEDVVLTAAHCLESARKIVALHDRGEQTATQAVANPLYGPRRISAFDVGLVLFPGIARNLGVQPARFLLSRRTQIGDEIKVVGYGLDGTPELVNNNPRAASLTVQGFESGLIVTLFNADSSGACFGDSGAAATYQGRIVATVHGGGESCGEGNINFFADLTQSGNYAFLQKYLPGVPLG